MKHYLTKITALLLAFSMLLPTAIVCSAEDTTAPEVEKCSSIFQHT